EGAILQNGTKMPATMGRVLDAVRDLYPKANIVASPEVADMMLVDLKLRSTDIEETLEALRVATGDRFIWQRSGDQPGSIDPTTGIPVPARPAKESSLYMLMANAQALPAKARREVEVFNLSGYINKTYGTEQAGKRDGAVVD